MILLSLALGIAARNGGIDIVKYLVENGGADVDTRNANGQSPAKMAANFGFREIADYLINRQTQG